MGARGPAVGLVAWSPAGRKSFKVQSIARSVRRLRRGPQAKNARRGVLKGGHSGPDGAPGGPGGSLEVVPGRRRSEARQGPPGTPAGGPPWSGAGQSGPQARFSGPGGGPGGPRWSAVVSSCAGRRAGSVGTRLESEALTAVEQEPLERLASLGSCYQSIF